MPRATSERYRRARMMSFLSQHEQAEERFRRDMLVFFRKQIRHIQQVVRQVGRKSPQAYKTYGVELAEFAFRPREWDEMLIETAKPHFAMSLLLGAAMESWLFRYVAVARIDPEFGEWAEQSFKSVQKVARKQRLHHAAKVLDRIGYKGPGDMIPFPDTLEPTDHLGPAFYKVGLPPETMKEMREKLRSVFAREDYWKGINDTTKTQLERMIGDAVTDELKPRELAGKIAEKLGGESMMSRATAIVRTETTNAFNAGHTASMGPLAQAGLIEGKEWLAVIDDNTRLTHADATGQQVAYNQPFNLGGYEAEYPGDEMLPAEERCNCRCAVFSVYPDDLEGALARADAAIDAGQTQPGGMMPNVFAAPTEAQAAAQTVLDDVVSTVNPPVISKPTSGPWPSLNRPKAEARNAFNMNKEFLEDTAGFERTKKHIFGDKSVEPHHIAEMAGAPDGATVDIMSAGDHFMMRVQDKNYGIVADRVVRLNADGKPEIYNMYLKISKGGEGTGTRMLMRQVDAARKRGVGTISCEAAGSADSKVFNGYYSWAKLGYDGDIPDVQRWMIRAGDGPVGVSRTSTKIHQLMQTKEGRAWWKENGSDWEAVFKTHSKARSYQILKEYHDARFGLKPKPKPVPKAPPKPVYAPAKTKKAAQEFCESLPMVRSADFSDITLKQANRINKKLTEMQNSGAFKANRKITIEAFKAKAKDTVGGGFQMHMYADGTSRFRIAGNFDDMLERHIKKKRRSLDKELAKWTAEREKLRKFLDDLDNSPRYAGVSPDVRQAMAEKWSTQMKLIDDYLNSPSCVLTDAELRKSVLKRWNTRATTLEDAIEHEFGHVLEADLQVAYKSHSAETRRVLADIKARSGYRQDNEALLFGFHDDVFDTWAEAMGPEISAYACTNGKEYFAESFLMYRQTGKIPDELLMELFKGLGL